LVYFVSISCIAYHCDKVVGVFVRLCATSSQILPACSPAYLLFQQTQLLLRLQTERWPGIVQPITVDGDHATACATIQLEVQPCECKCNHATLEGCKVRARTRGRYRIQRRQRGAWNPVLTPVSRSRAMAWSQAVERDRSPG
jgi:hypothetical protein